MLALVIESCVIEGVVSVEWLYQVCTGRLPFLGHKSCLYIEEVSSFENELPSVFFFFGTKQFKFLSSVLFTLYSLFFVSGKKQSH